MNFKSLPQLLDHFKDESTCIEYYENIRWGGKPVCPHCAIDKAPYRTTRGFKCSDKDCGKKFTVKVGTIFHDSKIPLRIWFAAIFLATAHKKGISSVQLAIDLGITQKTAWFVLHRIREMLKDKAPKMLGKNNKVEVDEAYLGGKEANKHYGKKRKDGGNLTNDGSPYEPKKVIVGLIERKGDVVIKYIPSASQNHMVKFIESHVPEGSTIYSDESRIYHGLYKKYTHGSVSHSIGNYVTGDVHSNTIENFWSVLKRGIYGVYHHVSNKHTARYLDEYAGRFNTRHLSTQGRFENFLVQSESRLPYKKLIAE